MKASLEVQETDLKELQELVDDIAKEMRDLENEKKELRASLKRFWDCKVVSVSVDARSSTLSVLRTLRSKRSRRRLTCSCPSDSGCAAYVFLFAGIVLKV